ncbi:MAG: hypothetical protein ACRD2L_00725 [Terriglobia bacterium]
MSTFTAATDELLADMIRRARQRVVFISPGVTEKVAEALGKRFLDEGTLSLTVILDADPEVYRHGYGTMEGISALRKYADQYGGSLRCQPGVRIGILIADDQTLIYAPTPQSIEGGPQTAETPNAVLLPTSSNSTIAEAAGASDSTLPLDGEIGKKALTPQDIKAVEENLRRTPPAPFDLARQAKVFSSILQYVEFEVSHYKFSRKEATIPPDLLGLGDDDGLKNQWRNSVRVLDSDDLKVKLTIETTKGPHEDSVDQEYLEKERKKIETEFLIPLPDYGNVLFRNRQADFEQRKDAFLALLEKYHETLTKEIDGKLKEVVKRIANDLAPRVIQNPPRSYRLHTSSPTEENIKAFLKSDIEKALSSSALFQKPQVRCVVKDISYQSFKNNEFCKKLHTALRKRKIPEEVMKDIFREYLAVLEKQ